MTVEVDSTPTLEVTQGIARISLRRPRYHNRLHAEDLVAISEHLAKVDADQGIRVLVIQAEVRAERPVFCSGFHIGQFDDGEPPLTLEKLMLSLEKVRPVTICALNGSIYGGATDFLLASDIVLAHDQVQLRLPTAAIGIQYHPTGLIRYVNQVGVRAAKYAILTAEHIDAKTLQRWGVIQELCAADLLDSRVDELANKIAGLAPLALDAVKQSLNEIARGNPDMEVLEARSAALINSEDFAEGRRAFAERRAPRWKGC
ncbi:enoyl-CoA hydratase/isomerase family protein [Rhodococcus opacus]|uniref:enoyl-CoA hydratase/isomerase family protein n=1 Tax=Rhodococcus opacus TaxID=37919 RepID=UPI001C48CE4D|nr:enoyl-CoA hydratase/isomerase family protein [Rhodococcus opacus]MBV6756709.1 enoyl-CoA hydratase/isomerase family protein [Rhodococcus opacus]